MIVHSLFYLLLAILIVFAGRWIASTSRTIALLFAAGVVIRLVSGLGLLAVSYSDAGFLRGFHTGDGFWSLAPDARDYFILASRAATSGALMVETNPSPVYVAALGGWFSMFGPNLVSAVVFNVSCYVVTCVAVVAALRSEAISRGANQKLLGAAGSLIVASFTFSPLLVVSSTQALKDPFFAMLTVLGCVGTLETLAWMTKRTSTSATPLLAGLLVVLAAVAGIAGTRAYYGVLFWLAYAAGALMALWVVPGGRRWRVIVSAVTMLTLMWVVFRIAAGPYYETYRALAASVVSTSDQKRGLGLGGDEAVGIREQIITFRRGFVHSAGATNLASSSLPQTTPLDIARDTAVGTAAMLVPISLLQALSVVDLRGGGRGLMWFTDLDTLFLEVSLAAALFLVIRNRSRFWQDPTGVVFMVVLSVATGLLAAYIVTNFGTLFRLRMLAVVPAWLLPLASAATSSRAAAQEKSGSLSAVG